MGGATVAPRWRRHKGAAGRGEAPAERCAHTTPSELAGSTQSPCLVVAEIDAVHARATAAGAEIVIAIKDEDYGGRGFSCRDPEGHLWTIGTYDPWRRPAG
jgi:uncharacterized glyoxalase superfamily protein PhnB